MKRFVLCSAGLAMLGLGLLPAAQAISINNKFALFGNLGYNMYAMDDFNNAVEDSGLEKITNGISFGGGLQYGLTENLLAGVEVQYLTAGEKVDVNIPLASSSTVEISSPLLEIGILAKGVLPAGDRFLLTGGLGIDYLSFSGIDKASVTVLGITASSEAKSSGSGLGIKIMVGGEAFLTDMLSIGIDLGYRMAKIGTVTDEDGHTITKADGSNYTVDYSGGFGQLGLKIYF